MKRKNTPPVRVDPDFFEDLKKIAQIRLEKGLANFNIRELSFPEMTRLLRRTNGYRISLEELKTRPKRRENEK
ncbi:MAG: hypothetical protein KatS3mg096_712 [Candidatus Parcubacteria bacterium]|nr:MAG: hypothetical protein KatS3mg096_685 [Candidatus Parcubacteria bacterium]GIW67844.1 MAG: hypothetical protein KatS3mg096_712 [Candidatus Parcubacteria bacterium]